MCTKCGYEANADYNASRNIATKDIDKIIAEIKELTFDDIEGQQVIA